MQRGKFFGFGFLTLLLIGGYAEHRVFTAGATTNMGAIDPTQVALQPAPIRREWIIEGQPKTEATEIAKTSDASTQVFVWATTKARFHWNYDYDEVVTILDGEVFITDASGKERHLRAGDVAFFPVGARTTWNVPDHLRKIAVLKKPLPSPVASLMRWMRTAKAMIKPAPAFAAD